MILIPNEITDKLESMISAEFPGEKVYRELVPSDFVRPSNLIVQDPSEIQVDLGCSIMEVRTTFTITTYVTTDEYAHSHLTELHIRQMRLLKLFLPGFIKVGDRAPKVKGTIKTGGGYDYDTLTVTLAYTLNWSDFLEIPQLPAADQLHLNEEVTTYG